MAIIARSGTFKPSDPFGLYRDRPNPLDPAAPAPTPVDPEQLRAADEIRRAEEANARVDQSFEQLEQQEPGRYQVIESPAYEEWRSQWEAKQPGWLEDTARILGGSLAKGTGAVVGGLGNAITALTNATTTPVINSMFGTDYGRANPLGAPAEWLNTLGEKTQEGVSFATREAIENSTPDGDLLDPSTWTLGKNPSAVGYGALVLDVFGQMTPVIAAAVVAGPVGGAAVGGLQGGGAAAQQASAIIDQMAAEPGLLERESAFYRELIASGKTHDEALAATKAAAEQAAFALASPISALGGFATGKIVDPATAILAGRNLISRITGRAALSGLEEGAQEAAETAATRAGVNVGADASIALNEGTFADFMLGALAGGAPGAIAGAFSSREGAAAPGDAPAAAEGAEQPLESAPAAGAAAPAPAPAPAPKAGPLVSALEHGLSQAPSPNAGQMFIVNDPPLPGMGAGREHGMTVTLAPNQAGIDPNMRRVVTADGSERVIGVRLLEPVDGSAAAPDPQATSTPISVTNVAPGLPEAGSRVIVEAPGMETFNARVETYVTSESGNEAVVVDDFGEVLQLPVEYLTTAGLTNQMIASAELAENPPVAREPVPESPTVRQVGPAVLTFPDETLARLYDLGRERAQIKRLERGANGANGLAQAMREYAPDRVAALADELGVLPERINEIADDYRYRAERAAKRAESALPQNMHGLNRDRLKAWQAERSRTAAAPAEELISSEATDGAQAPDGEALPSSRSDDFGAWWDGLSPGARKALLASAGVKRSEKSTWDKFTKAIKGRLMPLREEMAALDRARANSRALDEAAHAAATSPNNDLPEPTQAQKEAGNYTLGHARVGGMDLSIENPAGSERKGTDKDGKPWSVTMKSHYGYIKGTVGKDKDHIDVFVKPGTDELADDAPVFVVDQVNEDGEFDEHKVMLGFADQAEAEAAYLENYTKGWKGMGGVGATTLAEFKQWLKSGNTSKPFSTLRPKAAGALEARQPPMAEEANPRVKRDKAEKAPAITEPAKPYDAAKELPAQVLRLLEASGRDPVARIRQVVTDGGPNKAILDAWAATVGESVMGMGGDRVMLTARGRTLEVTMPSPDGTRVVRKVFKGGDLVQLIRDAVALAPVKDTQSARAERQQDPQPLPNATAPEHAQVGVDDRELSQIVQEFNSAQADMMQGDHPVSNVFQAPKKGEIVRLAEKVKVYNKQHGWMTPAEAKARIAEWKDHAREQGEDGKIRSANADKVVLSLFDLSGQWSQPWEDAGYQVYRFDIQADPVVGDVNNFSTEFFGDWFGDFDGMDIYAVLAACPCTDFAVSGARHFAAKDADGRTVASVKLVHQTLRVIEYFKPAIWAVENPVGRIQELGGLPPWRLSFDPNHIGDPYTKKTLIWGRFNADLPIAPVEPTEGSKMHRQYGGKSLATKNARSVTPEGFAYGFFMANNAHDHAAMAVANKYDRLDRSLIERAIDAGVTPDQIDEAVEDFYYFHLDDQAANEAIRALLPDGRPAKAKPKTARGPTPAPPEPANDPFAKNKLFTADKVAAARERLKSKMGQLNSGIDPEVLVDGMTIAGAYIEAGVRDFSDYAARMTEDFGDRIKPYLLSFWEGARNYPGLDTEGMTPAEDSARLHAGLVDPLPQEEAPALGQELAPPRKRTRKTGKAGDRTLIQDFGTEHIDAYTDEGEATKAEFLKDAVGYLRAVADLLQEDGWSPHEDKKGRPEKPVSKNESGIAGSGDVHLALWQPETGARLYAHVGGGSLRGVVPSTKSGVQVMFRVGVETDKYATGAMNQWAPVDLSAADFAAMVRQHADRAVARANGSLATDKQNVISNLKALIARPALTPAPEAGNENAEPRVGSRDPQGVGRPAGGREPDPQRGSAQADNRDLEAGEPSDVAPPAERRDGRNARTRAAAADVEGAGSPDLFGNAGDGRPRAGGAAAPDARARERDAERPSRAADAGPVVKDPETVSPANTGPGNFHIADPLKIVGGGQVARFEKNKSAITLAGQLRDEGRKATREEQEILAGYTGWGSFGQDLFQGTWANSRPKAGWEARDAWLRGNLGQAEWESLQRSITNAHYTDPPTVLAMWDMVKRMGFAGGRVLEPSMGIGNFFGMMPLELKSRSRLTGIELERVTGEMAQQLYPDANISIMGYQDSKTPDDFYDLVIGNWPFENTVIADRRYNRLSPMLHDYFYLKAVDQVRPGGLVVGITSKGTMDKKDSTIRTELAKKAELVAAFRLPSGAFEDYAGTAVVTDIIILRKRDKALGVAAKEGWIKSVPFKTPSGEDVSVNEYYMDHPDHVIGTIDFGTGTTFNRPGMIVRRPDDVAGELKRVAALVPQDAYRADSRPGQQVSYITNHTDDREGALTRGKGGGLYIVRGEHLVAAEDVAKFAVKDPKATAARKAQLEALIDMRTAYAELIAAERNPEGKPEPARKILRQQFEAFTTEHGSLTDSFGLAYLRKIDDPFYPALAALESRTDKGIKPAGILSQSTIRAARKIDKPTVSDAFVLARNSSINPSLVQIAQIAQKPEAEVRSELLAKGAVFELPNGDIVPSDLYLSGNVREKMRQARAALDDGNQAMERNIAALAKVMPPDVPYFNIEVQMGASWVPTGIYAEYVAHMLNAPSTDGIGVSYTAGRWRITLTDALKNRPEARAGFGTEAYSFRKLVNAAISNQTVVIRKEDSEGNTYVDQEETAEVNGKIEQIRTGFGDWLWSDPTRRLEMEAEYNEVRNAFASPSFDGSFLSFEGMALSLGNGPFDLRQHQVNAIWRALVMRRSLNAHEVGTGKTFTMGGIAVESRRYGIARKPLIFAHNANSKSVAAEIQQMYPAAKVLYIDNLAPAQIDVKMRQIANDDWDAVVVPHSLISRFALTEDTLMALAAEEIAAIEAEAYAAADDDGVKLDEKMLDDPEELKKLRSPTAKDLVKMRNRIIESIKKQGQRASKEGALSFEELGVDMLLVDEAHEFKKPPFSTRMRIKGLNTQSSDKSIALNFLTRYVRGANNGGNVHLFTGTPVTNTLTEVFHMMRYMMAEEMADMSVDQWDGWFGSFAKEVQDVELNAAAEYEAVNRLAGFINVPELRRMIGQYMDVVFADDMPEMQPRRTDSGKTMASPDLTERERATLLNGRTENAKDRPYKKVIVDTADLTGPQQAAFKRIQGLAQRWRQMTGKEKREAMQAGMPESPIIYEGLAAKASFDVRLMRGEDLAGQEGKVADDPDSKPSRAIKNLIEIYRSHPKATQVVFTNAGLSNVATRSVGPVGEKTQQRYKVFSTVDDMVERLVQQGIPRKEIAVVDGSTSKDKRKEIADAMNRAEIRIVIGSTQSLGVGVNMQRNLRAMHHMDAPWMPGDLEQRNGRGHRQGNQWNTVLEYRYVTDRLDGRRWQVLAIKQRFINAFLKADDNTRIIEGDAASDEESDILQTFAEAAGDPRVLIREKLKKKIEQLKKRQRLHDTGIVEAGNSVKRLERRNAELEKEIARKTPIADKVDEVVKANAGEGFAITIDGTRYDSRGDAREAIDAYVESKGLTRGSDSRSIGKFGGFALTLRWPGLSAVPVVGLTVDGEHIEGAVGSLGSLEAALRNYRAGLEKLAPEISENRRSIERLRQATAEPFHQAADLERAEADFEALETDLRENPVPPPAWLRAGAPVDTEVTWKGDRHVVTGHRWNKDGWFVLASGDDGPIAMPYLEVRDDQGMALYEERPFEAPEVVEKATPPQRAANDSAAVDDAAAQPAERARRESRRGGEPVARLSGDELGVAFKGPDDMPALRRAAVDWYDENLRGATVTTRDGREVRFTRRGMGKSTSATKGDILLRSVPAIGTIVEHGRIVFREPGNRAGVQERLIISAPVEIAGEVHDLAVSIHKVPDGHYQYDFTFDRDAIADGSKKSVAIESAGRETPRMTRGGLAPQGPLPSLEVPRPAAGTLNLVLWHPERNGEAVRRVRGELSAGALGDAVERLEASGRLRITVAADVGADDATQAWTDPDGSITLIADNIDPTAAEAVLLHEAFHSGARPLLGTPAFGSLMMRLAGLYRQFEQSKGRARDFFDAARARVSAAENQAGELTEPLRIEEFAAYAIEEHASAPAALAKWVEDFLGAIKAWVLKRFGRQVGAVTPGQLRAIAVTALREAVGAGALPQGAASRRQSIAGTVDRAKVTITRERIRDEIGGKLTDLKPAMMAAIPLNYFSELKRPGMYAVDQYLKVKRMMDAYRGNKHAAVDEVAQAWRKYARMGLGGASGEGKTRAAALADLMHETTLAGIDPSATDAETVAKPGYEALRARYMAMPEAGRALYRKVRDTYRDQADELDGILLDNVRKTQEIAFRRAEDKYREKLREIEESGLKGLDKSNAEREAQEIYQAEMNRATWNMKARMTKLRLAFEASRVPAPYFPLARFGRYFVSVKDIDGTVLSFSKRETDAERRRLERDMRAAFPNAKVESGLMPEQSGSRDMMDPRIVAEIETLLGDAGVDGKIMDMIWQRYLETMPDLSARKRFIHRKGISGFDGDALRTFASNQFHAAHQMARLKYGLELQELANQATDQARKSDDPVRGMVLANELKRRHEWVMNPTGSRAVQAVTSGMFVWYLAATPAAALINMTQTPMMGIPVLGSRLGGVGKAAAAIAKASTDVMRGLGTARRSALTADERRAMDAFYESGMIDRTQAHDLAGVGEVGVAYSPLRHKIMSVISWAYHNVEVWNREVTALAAYRMARDRGQHESQAIDTAHQLTWAAHFDYSNSSRPRVMQGDAAKLLLVFQSHQVNMWYRLFRDIHQSVKGESPQARKEARYQLAGILGMMTLFGGVSGIFGYNVLITLAGLAFDDEDDPRSFKAEMEGHVVDLLGPDLGGMVLKGVPGHLTGIDLTSRLGMPDFFVRAPDNGSEGRDWFQDLIVGAMGVVPATFVNAFDGVSLIAKGDVVRGLEVMAPKAVKDMMQAYRYANEGVLSRRGDVMLERDRLNAWDVIAEAVGFTPAKVAETYERIGVLKDAEQFVLDERRELMNRFAMAVFAGDDEARSAAIAAIREWNRKPYAKAVPITSEGLEQSLKARKRNAIKREDGALIADPELAHLLRQAMPERMY